MALDFEVNFQQAIQQVQDYQARMLGLGSTMDALEAKGAKVGSAHTKLFTAVSRETKKVEDALKSMGLMTEAAGKGIASAEQQISKAIGNIANRYVQASTQAVGFSEKSSQLHNVLSNTARLEAYSKWQRQTAALYEDQAGKAEFLRARLASLSSAEAKQISVLEAKIRATEKANRADTERRAKVAELQRELTALDSIAGRQIVRMEKELSARKQALTYLERQAAKTAELRAQKEFLESAAGREQALLQKEVQNRRQAAQAIDVQRQSQMELNQLKAQEQAGYARQRNVDDWQKEAEGRRRELAALRRDIEERNQLREQASRAQAGYAQQRNDEEWRLNEAARRRELAALRQHIEERFRLQEQAARSQGNLRAIQDQATQAQREQLLTGQELAWGYQRLTEAAARFAAQQERARQAVTEANRAMVEGQQNLERYTGANARAAQAVERLRRDEASAAASRKSELADLRRDIEERSRAAQEGARNLEAYTGANAQAAQAARRLSEEESRATNRRKSEMAELRRAIEERNRADRAYEQNAQRVAEATRRIGEAEARTRVERERGIAGAQAYNTAMQRNAAAIRDAGVEGERYAAQLRRVNATMLTSSAEKLNQQFTHLASSGRTATSSLQALSQQQAQLTASEERANRLLELRNRLTLDQARASQMRSGSEAQLTREIERQIMVQERRNRLMGMTTAELLGMSTANHRLSRDFRATAQAAAMFRAGLTGLHSSIGIYTGGTVLAAAATYAVAAALRDTVSAGMEFTETLSRAEAIMMTSATSFTQAGRSMEAVEMMVLALGASTTFTATQVAGGLVDLGMAGLSASDAMTALNPALSLAAIGAIDMSRAADIATNVMTSFNLTASDLGEVVDVMATAITNSNTNIEQLANALSYVGPAAQAAGFNLRDTTAAIQLLSNAGIKASRAGTGLRRFMLNIQNPTAKGADVLDRFGISIVDAEGQTRSMIDILGQFNRALHSDAITPAQRTAAIMDLVGVRAQSAVARMIGSFSEFGALRRQLEEVEGAAQAMRDTMEDNLTADWKQLKSAFQDVQLEVFGAYHDHLRELAASWRLTLMDMMGQVEGQDYTGIELLITRLDRAKDAALGIAGAFLAFKGARLGSTFLMAGAENAQAFADRLGVLNARTGTLGFSMTALNVKVKSLSASFLAHYANIRYAANGYSMLTAAAYTAGTALTYVARAASLVLAAAGWVGVIWGAYTAVKSLFGNDTEQRIEDHNRGVKATKARYEELQEAIESSTEARMRAALLQRQAEGQKELGATQQAIARLEVAVEYVVDEDSRVRLEDQLTLQRLRAEDLETQITDTIKALGQVGLNQAQYQQMEMQLINLAELFGDNRTAVEKLTDRKAKLAGQSRDFTTAGREMGQQLDRLEQGASILATAMAFLGNKVDESSGKLVNFTAMTQNAIAAQRQMMNEAAEFERMSNQEKVNNLMLRRIELMNRIAKLDVSTDAGADTAERLNAEVLDISEDLNELEWERHDAVGEGLELEQERQRLLANEEPTLANIQARLREINEEKKDLFVTDAEGNQRYDLERRAELLKEENSLLGQRNSLMSQADKAGSRGISAASKETEKALKEQQRAIEELLSSYQALRDEIYPLEASQRRYREEVDLLNRTYDHLQAKAAEAARIHGTMSEEYLTAADRLFDYNQVLEDHHRLRAFTDEDPSDVYDFMNPEKIRERAEENINIMDEFTKTAAENMQNHFAEFLFDPFANGLDGMVQGFSDMVRKMVAEAVAADLTRRLFGSAAEGGEGSGWLGKAFSWGTSLLGASQGAPIDGGFMSQISFDGGGHTGWGARAGGLDGKGGFAAILHPNETVIDHTKQGRGGPSQTITNNFLLQERKDNRTQKQIAMQAASAQRRATARFGA